MFKYKDKITIAIGLLAKIRCEQNLQNPHSRDEWKSKILEQRVKGKIRENQMHENPQNGIRKYRQILSDNK